VEESTGAYMETSIEPMKYSRWSIKGFFAYVMHVGRRGVYEYEYEYLNLSICLNTTVSG